MNFKDDIKMLRKQSNLTQEELAKKLHVTRQTVSTWETGKNMPSLETLHALSQLFNISLEKLLFNEEIEMKKDKEPSLATQIDHNVKLKSRYRRWTFGLGALIALVIVGIGILCLGYYKGIGTIDRVNPFLSYKVGYTKLPSEKEISNKKTNDYWTAWFTDNTMGNEWTKLTLTTGLNPGVKDPYVMAYHKGSYVKIARIVPRTYINQTYASNLAALDALLNNKGNTETNNHDLKKFKTQIHVSDTVQQLVTE
ncbi:helix-turn-helix transcriptional regulator [Lactobacillus sp. UCMA15818]|uniref:helix-turn-helix domain-containing protein n=1 Tax=Lactobacillus sp. UCMA15818 TaxID=2583394 RepID=UPI0025AF6E67|nr:helix-turn-helix transcriptional regulator [Lactobacillus sp. UCMA15818]MDN2453194.1 helix-turn-helix transcriptional regulator [Lactobacillus sp. UCMA15818]